MRGGMRSEGFGATRWRGVGKIAGVGSGVGGPGGLVVGRAVAGCSQQQAVDEAC